MCRFATEKYSLAKESLENTYIHLTNFTLNKKGERVTDYPPGCQVDKLWSILKDVPTRPPPTQKKVRGGMINSVGTVCRLSLSGL